MKTLKFISLTAIAIMVLLSNAEAIVVLSADFDTQLAPQVPTGVTAWGGATIVSGTMHPDPVNGGVAYWRDVVVPKTSAAATTIEFDYATNTAPSGLNGEYLMYAAQEGTWEELLMWWKYDGAGAYIMVRFMDPSAGGIIGNFGSNYINLSDGQMHHIALTYDNATASMTIDAVPQFSWGLSGVMDNDMDILSIGYQAYNNWGLNQDSYFDNFLITQVPEPSMAALFGALFGMRLLRRRK